MSELNCRVGKTFFFDRDGVRWYRGENRRLAPFGYEYEVVFTNGDIRTSNWAGGTRVVANRRFK